MLCGERLTVNSMKSELRYQRVRFRGEDFISLYRFDKRVKWNDFLGEELSSHFNLWQKSILTLDRRTSSNIGSLYKSYGLMLQMTCLLNPGCCGRIWNVLLIILFVFFLNITRKQWLQYLQLGEDLSLNILFFLTLTLCISLIEDLGNETT